MFGQTYEESSYENLPEGTYACTMENVVIGESKTKRTPCLSFTFKVADGDFKGRTIFHSLWFTEGAYNMTAGQLDKMMVFKKIKPANSMTDWLQNTADVVFQLVGKKIAVDIQGYTVMDNGKEYPKTWITGYLDLPNEAVQSAATGASPAPLDTTEQIPF